MCLRFVLLASAFVCLGQAQATRTWVSGVGDDVNPCSRTAPCKTFSGAISKTPNGGEIDCLDAGGFGAVTINKSITIDCGYTGGVLTSLVNGIIVNDTTNGASSQVILRNLAIIGGGTTSLGVNGISFIGGGFLSVQNVNIHGFSTSCISVTGSNLNLSVEDSNLTNCGGAGITGATASGLIKGQFSNVRIWNAAAGASTAGVNAGNNTRFVFRDCSIAFSVAGITQQNAASGSGSNVIVTGSTIGPDSSALVSANGSSMAVSGSTFFKNDLVFNLNGGQILTGSDNASLANVTTGSTSGAVPKI